MASANSSARTRVLRPWLGAGLAVGGAAVMVTMAGVAGMSLASAQVPTESSVVIPMAVYQSNDGDSSADSSGNNSADSSGNNSADNSGNNSADSSNSSSNGENVYYGKGNGGTGGGGGPAPAPAPAPASQVVVMPAGAVAAGDGSTSPAGYMIGAIALTSVGGAAALAARSARRQRLGRHEA